MNDETNDRFVRFMGRHLVALVGDYTSFNEDGSECHRGMFAMTGFVIEFFGKWFWVTAGHRLQDELDAPIRSGYLKIENTAFADFFGLDAPNYNTLSYTYEPSEAFYIDDPEEGLDFGLIALPDLYRRGMEKNGIVAISREHWVNQPECGFSQYKMLGLPAHLKQDAQRAIRVAMIDIEALPVKEWEAYSEDVRFIGRIPADLQISSIEGMSGGPIYGFRARTDGQVEYYVVALQSRWIADKKVIFGCSLPRFAEAVHNSIAAAMRGETDTGE
jgi:hypothetical protein